MRATWFDAIQVGIHARDRAAQRRVSERDIERVLHHPVNRYAGSSPGTTVGEGKAMTGRPIAVVYSAIDDPRGAVAYVVTAYPIRRFRDASPVVDEIGQALAIVFRDGPAEETIELADGVLLDVDADGRPLTLEFVSLARLAPFFAARGGDYVVPEQVPLPSTGNQRSA